jgi:CheY-like chemotaxis protein
LRFERLLSELSASFINLPASRIDAVIESGLRRIVETLDIDRSTLTRLAPDTGEKALAAGCDEFDTKPIDLERLVAKIRAALGRRAR